MDSSWDDWVPQDRLRKLTEDNKELAANLRRELTAQLSRPAKTATTTKSRKGGSELGSGRGSEERHSSVPAGARGTKRGRDNDIEKVCGRNYFPSRCLCYVVQIPEFASLLASQEDSFATRPSIRITIPDHLKSLLVDDWENVTKSLLLVPLPSQAPANYIIDSYYNEEKVMRRLGSAEADVLEEFCSGLKVYFEKSVGKILLYRFERSQLAEVCTRISSCVNFPFV